jgi:hypothetical protein
MVNVSQYLHNAGRLKMDATMLVQLCAKNGNSKLMLGLAGLALLTAGCASHNERSIPSWGGGSPQPPVVQAPTTYVPPEQAALANAPAVFTGRRSFTEGCSGGYSVRDARTNREISSGRAFNSGNGFIVLDSAGRHVRALSTGSGTSVLFLPDCNCRAGQTSNLAPNQTFAARAPSGTACSAT